MTSLPSIILASQSPRRRDLLMKAGVDFQVVVKPADELHDDDMPPEELCLANARIKADAVYRELPDATVIGADTLVFLGNKALGKPCDLDDARRMLADLSGKVHQVCTAVAIRSSLGDRDLAVLTEVEFRKLSAEDIEVYLSRVNVLDKAGAYAVQEHGNLIVQEVRGDLNNVIGLPVDALIACLGEMGYPCS